jgi:ubiquinone/menaquinone biosynthesis C-methylase UbiE
VKRLAGFSLPLIVCVAIYAQVAEHANTHYQSAEDRARMAKGLSAPDRDERQKPKELVEEMSLLPGMTVVDLGTGVGYMLPYLCKAVGPSGHVIAEDIFSDFLEKAKKNAAEEMLSNVTFVLGTETDPKLPEDAVDVVLVLDAYHHFNYPQQMLAAIRKSLRTGGRLVVVDYYKDFFRDPNHIRLDKADVIKEIESSRYRLITNRDHIPGKQYMLNLERQ